jgi:hypothetical protein
LKLRYATSAGSAYLFWAGAVDDIVAYLGGAGFGSFCFARHDGCFGVLALRVCEFTASRKVFVDVDSVPSRDLSLKEERVVISRHVFN